MSATGRPRKDDPATIRDEDDDYETPAWSVRAIWPHVRPITGTILEPCAGRGAIVEVLTSLYDARYVYACELDYERAHRCGAMAKPPQWCAIGDWLSGSESDPAITVARSVPPGTFAHPRLIITNPPYRLAQRFIEKSLETVAPIGGEVCMLLRLNFLGSQDRGAWLVDHKPDVYVLSERPSFTRCLRWNAEFEDRCPLRLKPKNGKQGARCQRALGHEDDCTTYGTDATEYCWMVWGPQRRGMLHILPPGPYGRLDWAARKPRASRTGASPAAGSVGGSTRRAAPAHPSSR